MNVPKPSTVLGWVQLFLTANVINYLTQETNKYAVWSRLYQPDLFGQKWDGITATEMAKYLGLRVLMGISKLPREDMYWDQKNDYYYSNPVFAETMSFERFKLVNKFLHCNDKDAFPKGYNTRLEHDRLLLVRPLINYFREISKSLYTPLMDLSLDEALLPWKGWLNFKVYNPKKTTKYGIKLYALAESASGYLLDILVYDGIGRSLRTIIFYLVRPFLDKGYRLYMDNFYNGKKVAEALYDRKTHCIGTFRMNRGAPMVMRRFAKKKQLRNSLMFRRSKAKNTFIVCWQDSKMVQLISNLHGPETSVHTSRKRTKRNGKYVYEEFNMDRPIMIPEYTKKMKGVDKFDQNMKYYHFYRKTSKWSSKMIFYLIQSLLLNAYILYKAQSNDAKKLTHLQFLEVAFKSLLDYDPATWPSNPNIQIKSDDKLPESSRQWSPSKVKESPVPTPRRPRVMRTAPDATATPRRPRTARRRRIDVTCAATSSDAAGPPRSADATAATTSDVVEAPRSADTIVATTSNIAEPPRSADVTAATTTDVAGAPRSADATAATSSDAAEAPRPASDSVATSDDVTDAPSSPEAIATTSAGAAEAPRLADATLTARAQKRELVRDPLCHLDSTLSHMQVRKDADQPKKVCRVCFLRPPNNIRRLSTKICSICNIALCSWDIRDCFHVYHSISRKDLTNNKFPACIEY